LSFHGAFEPGATESYNTPFLGSPTLPQTAELGSMWELGGAFTFPWAVMGYDGSLALGAQERSIQADRWTVMGFDADQFFSRGDLGEIAALSGLEFQRDDQLELSLCFYQDLVRGFRTEGKLAYTIQSMGDAFTVAGQINY
ncbi:MAG TPA: hypothetical protein VK842_00175, partial [bacterium]|nr:hypothetical protein [bacterium]